MPKISAVELFSCDKFEETPKLKVIDLSKFKKIYFSNSLIGDWDQKYGHYNIKAKNDDLNELSYIDI